MAGNPQIVVDYKSNTAGLSSGLKAAGSGVSKLSGAVKSFAKVGVAAAGAAGIGALVTTLKIGVEEFNESQKVMAQTGAVIKSTGQAANVTAKDVATLSEAIMRKTGIDDEAVASGQNMLLTFTNVRNEVGKGNDVFTQATQTMTDMSVALGQDMTKSAMQLGKALNDPVKGMTALQRVGVTFTKAQKDMVAEMVKSGDTMGAQKLILKELNKEFGGSAEAIGKTLPGQLDILRQEFNNLAGDLAARLMPSVLDVAKGMLGFVRSFADAEGAAGKFRVVIDTVKTIAGRLFGTVRDAVAGIDWAGVWAQAKGIGTGLLAKLRTELAKIDWAGIWAQAKGMAEGLQAALAGVNWAAVGATIGTGIAAAVALAAPRFAEALQKVIDVADAIDWEELGKAMGPGLAAAVATAFVTITDPAFWIRNWDLALAVMVAVFTRGLGSIAGKLAAPLVRLGGDLIASILTGIERSSPGLARVLLAGLLKLPGVITGVGSVLGSAVGRLMDRLGALATFTIKVIGIQVLINMIAGVVASVAGAVGKAAAAAGNLGKAIVKGINTALGGLPGVILGWMGRIAGYILSAAGAVVGAAYSIGVQIIQGMINGVSSMAGALASRAASVVSGAISAAKGALGIGSPSKVFAALGVDTINGYILGITQTAPKLAEKTREAVLKALDAARAVVESRQEAFRATFDKLGEYAARAFEGRTTAILAGISSRYDAALAKIEQRAQATADKFRGIAEALTPAEKAIEQLQDAEAERQRDMAVQGAQAALAAAQTEEARIAAVEQLRVAEQAKEIARLQALAVEERKAQEKGAAAQIAAAEKAAKVQAAKVEAQKAKSLQNAEETRRQAAEKLDEQLENLRERLAKHPEEHAKVQQKIVRLLGQYGVDYRKAGLDLGKAFAKGMDDAQDDVTRSAKALANIVARYLPHSPAETGPLARTDFFRGFGRMLASNLLSGAGALQSAASRMAGVAAGPLSQSLHAPTISAGSSTTQVRVFIGDQELRGLVRTEIVHSDTNLARTLLAGAS